MAVTFQPPFQDTHAYDVFKVGTVFGGEVQYTSIQTAIDRAYAKSPSATSPITVYINPGTYNESLTMRPNVNLVGVGPKCSVFLYQNDATILDFSQVTTGKVQIENVTVELGTPTAAVNLITDGGTAVPEADFTNVQVLIDTPGAYAHNVFDISGDSYFDLVVVDCHPNGTGASNIFNVTGANASVNVEHGDINNQSTSATCSTVNCAGTNALVEVDNSDVFAPYGVSLQCSAGIIIIRTVHYHSVSRSGTGHILDHSEYIIQYIWHIFTMSWDISSGNANINRGTANGGSITAGGTGQVVLAIGTGSAAYAWIGNNTDVAGSLASTFNPTRTPRNWVQFSVDTYNPNTNIFLGLRTTQGATIPTTENHVGFAWNGTNFVCSNADGTTQVTTVLTTPAVNVQHQLDMIVFGGVRLEFYVDGHLVHTETTHLPTGELTWQKLVENTATAAAGTNLTLRRLSCYECPT